MVAARIIAASLALISGPLAASQSMVQTQSIRARYVIVFPADGSVLTRSAQLVLDRAAADFRRFGTATIVITGDRSAALNCCISLSQRRANAVRAYLTGVAGIPASVVITEAPDTTQYEAAEREGRFVVAFSGAAQR